MLLFGCGEKAPVQPAVPQQNATPVVKATTPPVVAPPAEVKDTTPPALLIMSPKEASSTAIATVNVSGSTESGAKVTINKQVVSVNSGGLFSTMVSLSEGANSIEVVSADASGNKAAKTVTVTYTKPVPPAQPETQTNVSWDNGKTDSTGAAYDQASIPMSLSVGTVIGVNVEGSTLVFGGLPRGAQSVKTLSLTNYKSTPVKIKTRVEGTLKTWTTAPAEITLAGDETKKIDVTVNVPENAEYGNYTSTFIFEIYP